MAPPLKAILIDDESLALDRLQRLLGAHGDLIQIVDRAGNGREAVTKINQQQPDVIFLDIQMPGLNGFEVIQRLETYPWVIFCSAYDEYALNAFETNAVDYLLKPVDPVKLERAINKLQRMTAKDKADFESQLHGLMATIQSQTRKRIQVRSGDEIRLLKIEDIYYFKASDKYVEVHTFDEIFLLSQSLKQLEAELPTDDFTRIHRSLIVNLNHLEQIRQRYGSSFRAIMRDKKRSQLPISRHFKANLGI